MTKEEILELARQSRFFIKDNEAYSPSNQEDHELTEHLERFANLVAKHECEACALIELHGLTKRNLFAEITEGFDALTAARKGTRMIEDDDDIQDYKKPWVGLTDEEVQDCLNGLPTKTIYVYARRIEKALKDKNT